MAWCCDITVIYKVHSFVHSIVLHFQSLQYIQTETHILSYSILSHLLSFVLYTASIFI